MTLRLDPVETSDRAEPTSDGSLISTNAVDAGDIGALARRCLDLELATWPKPGLVSHRDSGSHTDMDAALLSRSAAVLAPFFAQLAAAGAGDADMGRLRAIGLDAEAAMRVATGGVNTHRGAIFGLGLLCAAAGRRARLGTIEPLGTIVRGWADGIRHGPMDHQSHGARAARRFGAGGARAEAVAGFPSVYRVGLPAYRASLARQPDDREAARVHSVFALIATVDDTNLLHRGGAEGLAFAKREADRFLAAGGVGAPGWREAAAALHRAFVARDLSPGGSADLLAAASFLEAATGLVPPHRSARPASWAKRAGGPSQTTRACSITQARSA